LDILRATETEKENNKITPENYTFAQLADKYGNSVYKFCRSLAYSKEDADDLFQETFLKVFEQPDRLNASNSPRSFLFSTALYIWKSWKRKYARRGRIAPATQLDESLESDINIENDFIANEEIKTTRKLVGELPEKFKIPVILYYSMEMSVSEIAKTLGLPDGTVKSRLFKARKIIEKGLIQQYER
jgi:RNA polymerase sigma-70 factor (ECF subfamily)